VSETLAKFASLVCLLIALTVEGAAAIKCCYTAAGKWYACRRNRVARPRERENLEPGERSRAGERASQGVRVDRISISRREIEESGQWNLYRDR